MSNTFYNETGNPVTLSRGSSSTIRNEFVAVRQGFDKLPSVTQLATNTTTFLADTGAANAYVVTFASPLVPSSYTDGMEIVFRTANVNTGASTINVNALGTKSIVRSDGTAVQAGDIKANAYVSIRYRSSDGVFVMYAVSEIAAAISQAQSYAAGLQGTSTTSDTIGTGAKTFTTQSGKQFAAGQFVQIVDASNSANYQYGQITSYSGASLAVTVTATGGSGTIGNWNIYMSGVRGPQGAAGQSIVPYSARTSNTVLGALDNGYLISASGTWTQTISAASVLGASWWLYYRNTGSGEITLSTTDYVTNGTFAVDANWTKGSNWTIGSGVATRSSNATSTSLDQALTLTSGNRYVITVTVTSYTGGTLDVLAVGSGTQTLGSITAAGTYSYAFTADQAATTIKFSSQSTTNFRGSIDNASCVEAIDDVGNFSVYPGETRVLQCTGTGFTSFVLEPGRQTYTATTTICIPPGFKCLDVDVFGGGGGGGSGRRGAAGTARNGGSGGGGGARNHKTIPCPTPGTWVVVTVGAAGTGGAARSTNDTDGLAGTAGGNSSFGSYVYAYGGGPGAGGGINSYMSGGGGGGTISAGGTGFDAVSITSGSGGQPPSTGTVIPSRGNYLFQGESGATTMYNSQAYSCAATFGGGGGGGSGAQVNLYDGGSSIYGCGGGGVGGAITTADTASAGGNGGGTGDLLGGTSSPDGTGGSRGVSGGGAGSNGGTPTGDLGGKGGGGGGASTSSAGGGGGTGSNPGGGGGGGGASLNGFNSGAGGNGGRGEVRIQFI